MKKKSNYRTPKRLLSLFLCVLMVATSVVIANPFTASAASSFNVKPNILNKNTGDQYYENVDYLSSKDHAYAFADCNPASSKKYFPITGKMNESGGYDIRFADNMIPDYSESDYVGPYSSVSKTYYKEVHGRYNVVRLTVIFFNSAGLCSLYDTAVSQYGWSNTAGYDPGKWATYAIRLNEAKSIIENGVHVTSSSDTNLQGKIYGAWYNLNEAIKGLKFPEVTLGNVFVQVPGATIAGPQKIEIKKAAKITVNLHEGYTQSVPGVQVVYNNGTVNNYSGRLNGNRYEYSVTLNSADVKSIKPTGVNLNRYTVTVPSSATGLTIKSPGSHTVTHGNKFSFSVEKKTGYTQQTPKVYYKIGNSSNWVSIGGAQSGNTYTYTYNGVTNGMSFRIDNQSVNSYTVSYDLKDGVSKGSGTATKINHFGTATVKLTVAPEYSQRTPAPKASSGTLTYVSKSGTTYTYTLSGVTANTTVTVPALALNQYTVTIPEGEGYSLDATSKDVTHGNTTSFTVTLDSAHNQNAPVAKIDGKELTYTKNGDSYTFKTDAITDFKTVEIGNIKTNTYNIGYSCGAGTSAASGTATTIQHGGNATVKITVAPEYSQRTPAPTASNGTLTYVSKSGTTYTYTLSGVTANTTVNVPALALNQYTVTIPKGTGYSLDATSKIVTHGETTTFTVTLDSAHNQNAPVAKIDGKALSYTQNGNSYTFTTGAITDFKTVEIGNVQINKYQYTLPTGAGFTVANAAGMDCTSITHGNDYSFTVTVDKAYTQTVPTVTLKDGTVLTADSAEFVGGDEKGDKVYTYTVKNVTDHNKITVAAMSKNTYSAVLPYDKTAEASYKVTNAKADANNVVSGIVYGDLLTFGVALAEQYNRSTVVVKYKGDTLTPDEGGVYTINNITQNITEGDIVVEGVELNHYYITLPLETETGFVIEVGEGLNAKSVLSRTDFNFKFFLDPAYSDSTPTIKVSRDGGDHYSVLTEADGKYTIENVLSDCIVVVEGVKKNTYTVKFVDEGGNVLEEKKGVEYGSDVKFTGDTPTKATETVSETTDAAGNTVLVERKYKFIGWSADTSYVTSNMEVTPIFEVTEVTTTTPVGGGESETVVTKKTANILFISDEVIVHKETVEKGQAFSGWAEVPVKTSSNPYETYEFLGWDIDKDGKADYEAGESNAIADVQDDVTFVAVFKSNLPTQTVNFYSFDGSKLLYTANVKRGERAAYGLSGAPSRADKSYEYTFEGWSYEQNADETTVLDKIVVGENDITVYAAYSKEVIIYTYKYINDGVELQSGTYNFVDGKGTDYKYTGSTPTRDSSKSTDYTFDGWLATTPDRYSTEYIATYSESVREYDYALPTPDGSYTIDFDKDIKKIPYNGKLTFTVTLDEGYTQTPPVVTSNGTALEYEKSGENSYVFTIVADGADADEIKAKLTKITVETAINHYNVAIGGDAGADISTDGFKGTEYNSNGTFTVTLKEGYTQNAPVVTAGKDERVVITLDKAEGNVYTYTVSEIKSNATITVATKINEYPVVLKNWDGKDVFNGNVKHGEAPVYKTPTKPIDANGQYDFVGWDTDGDGAVDVTTIENVTAPVTAKAVYNYNHRHDSDPADPDSVWELVKTDRANCTKSGMKYYVCKHCGEQTKNVVIPARGHKWTAEGEGWIIVKAPTCTETGLKSRYCCNEANDDYDACNYKEENVVVPATGHHDSDEDYICDDCGVDLGHCSKCICHKGNILSKVLRYICTLLTKTFHKPIKCCKDMDWYGDKISSIT